MSTKIALHRMENQVEEKELEIKRASQSMQNHVKAFAFYSESLESSFVKNSREKRK